MQGEGEQGDVAAPAGAPDEAIHDARVEAAGIEAGAAADDAAEAGEPPDAQVEAAGEQAGGEAAAAADEAVATAARGAARVSLATGLDPEDPKTKHLVELENLCGDLERVVTIADVKLKTLEKRLASADNKYPKLLPLPSSAKRVLAERFQEARRKLAIRIGELKEQEEWKRWANVPTQEALIGAVEGLLEGEPTLALVDALKRAQDEWKNLGPAPQDKAQELWTRFKAATDKVYEKVKELRAIQDVEFQGNLEKKRALCEQAEQLSESTDWGATADQLKRLQAEWKAIGPVPRKQADAIWKRFRGACDAFFEARRPHLERALGEKQANLDAKRGLVERLEQLAQGDDLEAAAAQVGEARRQWKMIGQIPYREFEQLSARMQTAADAIFARRDESRAARAGEARASVEGPLGEAEAMLATEGAELDGAELAQRTIKARAALRELEHKDERTAAPLRARVEDLTRRAVAAAATAFRGSDLDPEQSRKRKEKLVAKIEELAPAPAAASGGGALTAADMAAKLKAALADRALGGILSQAVKGRAARDVVAEARESWSRLGPVPGSEGDALEQRFADACKRATAQR
jgi:hypothetical protein